MARCSAGSAVAGKQLGFECRVGKAQPLVGHHVFGALAVGEEQADLEIFVGQAVAEQREIVAAVVPERFFVGFGDIGARDAEGGKIEGLDG